MLGEQAKTFSPALVKKKKSKKTQQGRVKLSHGWNHLPAHLKRKKWALRNDRSHSSPVVKKSLLDSEENLFQDHTHSPITRLWSIWSLSYQLAKCLLLGFQLRGAAQTHTANSHICMTLELVKVGHLHLRSSSPSVLPFM